MICGEIIKCDACGRFIPIIDIDLGRASHKMITPDSGYTSESYESICFQCIETENILIHKTETL